jgi:hypothetical protein
MIITLPEITNAPTVVMLTQHQVSEERYLRDLRHALERDTQTREGYITTLKDKKDRLDALQTIHAQVDPALALRADLRSVIDSVHIEIQRQESDITDLNTHLERLSDDITRHTAALNRIQSNLALAKLQSPPQTIQIDVDHQQREIKTRPFIYTAHFEYTDDLTELRCIFTTKVMPMHPLNEEQANVAAYLYESISNNTCIDINTDPVREGGPYRVVLEITTRNNERHFALHGTDDNTSIARHRFRGRDHPHWVGRSDPCLGDFTGPIYQALESGDFVTAIDVLLMYLGHYNADDSAGVAGLLWGDHHKFSEAGLDEYTFSDYEVFHYMWQNDCCLNHARAEIYGEDECEPDEDEEVIEVDTPRRFAPRYLQHTITPIDGHTANGLIVDNPATIPDPAADHRVDAAAVVQFTAHNTVRPQTNHEPEENS